MKAYFNNNNNNNNNTKRCACLKSALFWDITQRRVVVLYRRFGTIYRSHLQGPSLGLLAP